ncbi:hypothetical protein PG991_010663 [Apiospora marii]|uniref:Glycosyltransferase family 25 protein n=1 Tax=Apiospora marii TaxID=335849 RepID=A0ABR1RBW6_9PEZI
MAARARVNCERDCRARTDRRDAMALAAAVSNLTLDWVDGIDGDTIEERVLPPGDRPKHKSSDFAVRGSWRAHMNALRRVVEEGLPSALIMEDDVDWDLRVKSQLQTFGAASKAWLQTSREMASQPDGLLTEKDRLGIYKTRRRGVGNRGTSTADLEVEERCSIYLDQIHVTNDPASVDHPYGEGWDVLWLGHCGTEFPDADATALPPLRAVVPNDPTVPAPQHLKPHPFASHDVLGELYPPHTRVVHAASSPRTACTLAYAVSQRGARKLLWQFGLEDFSRQWDLMLGSWCAGGYVEGASDGGESDNSHADRPEDGKDDTNSEASVAKGSRDSKERRGRRRRPRQPPTCLTVQPPIFGHYFAKKGASDIRGQGGGYVSKVGTPYVRWSVRMNLDVLTEGSTAADVVDQLPDDGEAVW